VTFKCNSHERSLDGTVGWIIHDLLLVESFDVEYYRDLEMWVRGHSKSYKLVPFRKLAYGFLFAFLLTMAVSLAVCKIFSVKEWRYLENWVRDR